MTQQELLKRVAELSGTGQAQTASVLEAFGEVIAEQLDLGDSVEHRLIGKFSLGKRDAHPGRNPQTGEAIQIAARRAVKYRPAKALKDRLNTAPAAQRKRA